MKVLSLFDGMSCGRVALERAGLKPSAYFAAEIDKYAITIAQKNFPDTIQLGDVIEVRKLAEAGFFGKIDLLIGGSPCQGFSFAGKQLAFDDPRSALFFEYVKTLRALQRDNPDIKFLLENVRMKKEYLDVITSYMGVEPVCINSALVSAQNRVRYYWANWKITQPDDRGLCFQDIKSKNFCESLVIPQKYKATLKEDLIFKSNKPHRLGGYMKQGQGQRVYSMLGKSVTLSALGGGWGAKTGLYFDNGIIRKPTIQELEKLQNLPEGYLEGLNYNQAAKMCGNGWETFTVTHIFECLKESVKSEA